MNNYSQFTDKFWESIDTITASHEIIIDRPKDSVHPRIDELIYPVDYGYLSGTKSGDGKEIDLWYGSAETKSTDAVICMIDSIKLEAEIKLLYSCTDREKKLIYQFHNIGGMKAVMVKR